MASLLSLAIRVSVAILACIIAAACGSSGGIAVGGSGGIGVGGGGGTGGGGASPTNPPSVVSVIFDGPATGVFLNGSVAVLFNQPMDPATFSSATFVVSTGGNPVGGTISTDGEAAVFTPMAPLAKLTTYRLSLSPTIRSSTGSFLAPFVVDFTTGTGLDTTTPAVESSSPPPGSTNVNLGSVSISFSEPVDPISLTTANLSITGPGGVVEATVTRTPATAVVTPAAPLAASTTYTVTVSNGVRDLAGNRLPAGASFTFSTGSVIASLPLQVIMVSPPENAVGVSVSTQVMAVFSEALDQTTLNGSTFTLAGPEGTVPGVPSVNGATATFTPSGTLLPLTRYQATVFSQIKSLAGMPMISSRTWSFTTGAASGTAGTGPQVISTTPQNSATGVPLAAPLIAVIFDRAIDPVTVTPFTVTLSFSGIPVQVTASASGATLTLVPVGPLQANTVFTVTLTTGIRDMDGNPLAAPVSWNFTTGSS